MPGSYLPGHWEGVDWAARTSVSSVTKTKVDHNSCLKVVLSECMFFDITIFIFS